MEKLLILVGASVRAAAHSAVRAGFQPVAIDLFGDLDLPPGCPWTAMGQYPQGLVSAFSQVPQAPWLYTGGLENYPALVDRLSRWRPLWGTGGGCLRAVRDPARLAKVLQKAGFPCPRILESRQTAGESNRSTGRWLCKPLRGSGGTRARLARASDFTRLSRGCYLQEYIEGLPASAVFVGLGDAAMYLGATRQLIGRWDARAAVPAAFQYAGSIGPLDLQEGEVQRLKELGNVLSRAFGLIGLFGVDFIHTPEESWTVEVNPRYTASVEILERAFALKSIAFHAAACQGLRPDEPARIPSPLVHGKAVVYAGAAGFVPESLSSIVAAWNRGAWPFVADIPRCGEPLSPGQPVVTVFADGADDASVERLLSERVREVAAVLRGELSTEY